jgi:ABC-type nickel/cobalt efflux system permease component RcnA
LLVGVAAVTAVPAASASAHPLGNFTINQFSGLRVYPQAVQIDLVTDMAEIPTFQVRGEIDADHDGRIDPAEAARWRLRECASQARKLSLDVDGRAVAITVDEQGSLTFPPGQAGLDTLRLECSLTASLRGGAAAAGAHLFSYLDANYDGRLGWREINVEGGVGASLTASNVAAVSVSHRLTQYPADLLRSPLAQHSASVRAVFAPAGATGSTPPAPPLTATGPSSILPRGVDRATRAFTALVARQRLGLIFGIVAMSLAVVLGALHALAPGHGKTVMAAYLVGQRGSLRHAVLISATVTATHTAGVLVLGIVLTTSAVVAPERLYPWLGLASGLLLAGIGLSMLARARRVRSMFRRLAKTVDDDAAHIDERVPVGAAVGDVHVGARHDDATHGDPDHQVHLHHAPGVGAHDKHRGHLAHDHHGRVHRHRGRAHVHPSLEPSMGWRSVVAMGFAGGLVPSPSALVVLLGAIALHRAWFGLLLVVAYGTGMAATLTSAGLLLERARRLLDRRADRGGSRLIVLTRWLPTATALIVIVLGLSLAARAAVKV